MLLFTNQKRKLGHIKLLQGARQQLDYMQFENNSHIKNEYHSHDNDKAAIIIDDRLFFVFFPKSGQARSLA